MTTDHLYYKSERHHFEVWRGKRIDGRLRVQRKECLDAKWFKKDMLPHDENLAFGPDLKVIGKWAAENSGSRRVHYPRSKMRRAGFGLVVNDRNEVLLIQRKRGERSGRWSLPGGNAEHGRSRRDAAVWETRQATGIEFTPDRLYYENRHHAQIWLGKPHPQLSSLLDSDWFPIDELPDDDSLAFAIDVRTIEKWSLENNGIRRTHYP